eukprot:55947-Hanusia_phi.AAC.1
MVEKSGDEARALRLRSRNRARREPRGRLAGPRHPRQCRSEASTVNQNQSQPEPRRTVYSVTDDSSRGASWLSGGYYAGKSKLSAHTASDSAESGESGRGLVEAGSGAGLSG